jgi:RecA/RadA recombinase
MEFASFLEDKAKIKQDTGIKDVIPTGIDVLDSVMGGGFALGTMGMAIGTPGCGKSMLCIQTMASAQKKYKEKAMVAMLDSEEATTTIRLSNLGVRYPKITPYNDITVEKVFKFLEGLCLYKEMKNIIDQPSVVLWDSIANTLSQKEREVEDVNSVIGYKARLLSLLIPKYVSKLAVYNICLLTVNQMRDSIKIGPFQAPKEMRFMSTGKSIPGGNTMKFNAFHLIEMKVTEAVDIKKYGFEGIKVTAWCVKNKLFSPNIHVKLVGNFVTGFSNFWTNFEFLVDLKRIDTGAWNKIVSDPKQKKFRTSDVYQLYSTDQEFREIFDNEVKDAIKIEIIDKHTVTD